MEKEPFADLSKIRIELLKELTQRGLADFEKDPRIQWTNMRMEKPLLEELMRILDGK